MTYREHQTPPPWEQLIQYGGTIAPATPALVRWGNSTPPPPVGTRIIVTINSCGPATVTGYFTQDGYLGLRCDLLDPPEWHRRQNKGNVAGHVFGPEFRVDEAN